MKFGVQVVLKDGREGHIIRRLDAQSYEVWIEKEKNDIILSPDEFVEKENDE